MLETIILIYIVIGFMYGLLYLFDESKPSVHSVQEIGLIFFIFIIGWFPIGILIIFSYIYKW